MASIKEVMAVVLFLTLALIVCAWISVVIFLSIREHGGV